MKKRLGVLTILVFYVLTGCSNQTSLSKLNNNSTQNTTIETPSTAEAFSTIQTTASKAEIATTSEAALSTDTVSAVDSSNLSNNNDWEYYINEADKYRIYKKKSDNSNISKICDDESVCSLSVSGDWIYYTIFDGVYQLYKIKTDGSLKQKICDADYLGDPVEQEISSTIEGDWIIFEIVPYGEATQNQDDKKQEDSRVKQNTHTFKVSLDGKEHKQVN